MVNLEDDWQSPLHQKYISVDTRLRFEQLWADREQFYRIIESLPQCFAHFDCQRRNLLIQAAANEVDTPIIVIDWGICGVSALGAELQALVGGSTTFVEWPSSALPVLDKATYSTFKVESLHKKQGN